MLEVKQSMVRGIKREDTKLAYPPAHSFRVNWEPVYTKGKAKKVI